jgi:transposase
LTRLGHEAVVLQPRRIQLITKSVEKTDRVDAELLAFLGCFPDADLHRVQHRSEAAQVDLELLRARMAVVRARTMLINHARGAVKAMGMRLPKCNADYFHLKAAQALPPQLYAALDPIVVLIAQQSDVIRAYDREIERLCQERYPVASLLQKVNSVGPITSLTFVLTLEEPGRFGRSRQVGRYLGLTPGQRQSGMRRRELGITKEGDEDVRQLLVQCAQHLLGPLGQDCDLRRWGLAHIVPGKRRSKAITVVAVARKLAVLLHHLWLTGAVYDPFFGTKEVQQAA